MRAQISIVFVACFLVSHAVADDQLTERDEIRIGQILAQKMMKEEGMRPTPETSKIEQYLQSVGDRVAAHTKHKLQYQFHYVPDPAFKSAFALPGGQVFVGAGVMAFADTEDQLAAVLGHEVEHVDLGQCHERLVKVLADNHLTVKSAQKLKVEPFFPGYGHDNELAADLEGVKITAAAGYSPYAAVELLHTYLILADAMPNTPSEAKTRLQERIDKISQLIRAEKLPVPASEKRLDIP
jgi:predicted Zn-dependent protease